MRAQTLLVLAAATAASAQSTSAPVILGNPVGAQYLATLPTKEGSALGGSITAESAPDGKGVVVSVSISGLPVEGGPFSYHIHEKPVPADGNCTGTGAHLDPYKRGEDPPCDSSKPETCQTGDLSGKHGTIAGQDFTAKYTDFYLATVPSDLSYFGNLSVVVHLSNKTRISCANFTQNSPGAVSSTAVSIGTSGYAQPTGTGGYNSSLTISATATGTGSGSGSTVTTTGTVIMPSSPPPQTSAPANSAQKLAAGAGALILAAAALML